MYITQLNISAIINRFRNTVGYTYMVYHLVIHHIDFAVGTSIFSTSVY